jgi:hypothetical protein
MFEGINKLECKESGSKNAKQYEIEAIISSDGEKVEID